MGRVARASLIGILASVLACGSFLAAEEAEPGGGDAGTDGASVDAGDGATPVDADTDADAAREGCTVGSAFEAPEATPPSVIADVRSVRMRANLLFLAHATGGGNGVDLGGSTLEADTGIGPAIEGLFDLLNGAGAQTVPAPTNDGLGVVYQDSATNELRWATRPSVSGAFDALTVVTFAGVAIDGVPREPYLTSQNQLYFSTTTNKLYVAQFANGAVNVTRELDELGVGQLPVASDDGREIFFVREHNTVQKVYRASRGATQARYGEPVLDVPLSNNDVNTRVTWLSPDTCRMFLVRSESADINGSFALFIAKR